MFDLSIFDRFNFERWLVAVACYLLSMVIENLEEMDWVAGQIHVKRTLNHGHYFFFSRLGLVVNFGRLF